MTQLRSFRCVTACASSIARLILRSLIYIYSFKCEQNETTKKLAVALDKLNSLSPKNVARRLKRRQSKIDELTGSNCEFKQSSVYMFN